MEPVKGLEIQYLVEKSIQSKSIDKVKKTTEALHEVIAELEGDLRPRYKVFSDFTNGIVKVSTRNEESISLIR